MQLKDFRDSYHKRTEKASDIVRGTNYSLIAIIWILSGQSIENVKNYRIALVWLILSLVIDFTQYFIGAIIGTFKYRCEERRVQNGYYGNNKEDNADVDGYPQITPWISIVCFVLKIVCSMIAVSRLLYLLSDRCFI